MRCLRSTLPASREMMSGLVVIPEITPHAMISLISLGSELSRKSTRSSYHARQSQDLPRDLVEGRRLHVGRDSWPTFQRAEFAALLGKDQRRANACAASRFDVA